MLNFSLNFSLTAQEKRLISLVLLFLALVAILNSQPGLKVINLLPLHFFRLIFLNNKVPLKIHAKFQSKFQPYRSGGKVDFTGFAIFSTGGHLKFSTWSQGYKPTSTTLILFDIFEQQGPIKNPC